MQHQVGADVVFRVVAELDPLVRDVGEEHDGVAGARIEMLLRLRVAPRLERVAAVVGVVDVRQQFLRQPAVDVVRQERQPAPFGRVVRKVEGRVHAQRAHRAPGLGVALLVVVVGEVHVPLLAVGARVEVRA